MGFAVALMCLTETGVTWQIFMKQLLISIFTVINLRSML